MYISNRFLHFLKKKQILTYHILKCQVKILEKIVNIDLSLNSLIVTILKCRMYRGVTGFRPPPKYLKG